MPRTGSYGDTPTVTRSPGTTLIRKRRMRPLSCASTSWPGIALHAIEPAAVNRHDGALHVDEIVLAQMLVLSCDSKHCATLRSGGLTK